MPNYRNDLEEFIYEICYDQILGHVSAFVTEHPAALDLSRSRIKYPDTAILQNLLLEFTTNIVLSGDTLCFDAIMSGTIELSEEDYSRIKTAETNQWFRISCKTIITDHLDSFIVETVVPYNKGSEPEKEGINASPNVVPIIHKDELDKEAEAFLSEHYPIALEKPCAVPILDLAKNRFGLHVIQGKCITKDFSTFGQICFSDGEIELFDPFGGTAEKSDIHRGTIVIDAMTYFDRNIGCVNNTLAHEVYHWHRHRLYAAIKLLLHKEKLIAHRCPSFSRYPSENEPWTDEQRMEWQANKIAPRILMPISTFKLKVDNLLSEYEYADACDKKSIMECIIDELADFYHVSKQSAKIRLIDTGYNDAEDVYNYDSEPEPVFSIIDTRDAFYEYFDNSEFHELIDSGLFVHANGFFVINDLQYVVTHSDGSLGLTDYAWKNLGECTLQFTYRKVSVKRHGQNYADTFHRSNDNAYEKLPQYDASKNASVISHAAELQAKRQEFEAQLADRKIYTKTFWQRAYELMKLRGWNTAIFCSRTKLNEVVYSRAKNNHDSLPDVRTVISICAGLDLDLVTTNELLALAGHTLSGTTEHQAYGFIISSFRGKSIDERNEFLEMMNITPLGSKQRV